MSLKKTATTLLSLFLLFSQSTHALLTYSSLPNCAQNCALQQAATVQCYLPRDTLCFCASLDLVSSAYDCSQTACASESAQVRYDVERWFKGACNNPSQTTDLPDKPVPSSPVASSTPSPSSSGTGGGNNSYGGSSASPSTSSSSSSQNKGQNSALVAGVVAGVVVVLVAALLGAFFLYRKIKQRPQHSKGGNPVYSRDGLKKKNGAPSSAASSAGDSFQQWERAEIDSHEVKAVPQQQQPSSVTHMAGHQNTGQVYHEME